MEVEWVLGGGGSRKVVLGFEFWVCVLILGSRKVF